MMRGRTIVRHKLHIVPKRLKHGAAYYVYAWRGGPQIGKFDHRPIVTRELLALADKALAPREDTIDALIADYEASPEYERKSDATKRDFRRWAARISVEFGPVLLEVFQDARMRGDIIQWRNQWADRPASADKAAMVLSSLLNMAVDRGQLSINIAAGLKKLHHVDRSELIWEDRHWQVEWPPHLLDALKLAALTGLRQSDLVRLDWSHVGEKLIAITAKKNGAAVRIPMYRELREHLEAREWREGPVLRNTRGVAWTTGGLRGVFDRTRPEGFDRTLHDLRGTFVTHLAVKGLTDAEIARIVGWEASNVGRIRERYVDEARVVVSMAEKIEAA